MKKTGMNALRPGAGRLSPAILSALTAALRRILRRKESRRRVAGPRSKGARP